MSFNLGGLRQLVSQSPRDIINNQVNRASSQLTSQLTGSLSSALHGSGSTVRAITGVLSSRLDSIASGGLGGGIGDATKRFEPRSSNASKNQNPSVQISKTGEATAGSTNSLQYPTDLGKYFIEFAFGDYQRPTMDAQATFEIKQTIHLPMPTNLQDAISIGLDSAALNGIGQATEAIAAIVQDIRSGGNSIANTRLEGIASRTTDELVGAGYRAIYDAAGAFGNAGAAIAGSLGQMLGAIPNPYMTVFFTGVDLKTHSFRWRFAPRNPAESEAIKNIINQFKGRSLPSLKVGGSSSVLGYPNIVKIELKPNMSELYLFKRCMVKSVTSNYAPNGIPSFFKGTNSPTVIEFEVQFQEIEIVTAEDYGRNDDHVSTFEAIGNHAPQILNPILPPDHQIPTSPTVRGST